MTQDELQKLRDLPIEGVAQRLGIEVTRGRFLCPAHDDHSPSATVSKSGTRWKCWSCGATGNAIDLTMLVLKKDFKEACEWLGCPPRSPQGSPPLIPPRGEDLSAHSPHATAGSNFHSSPLGGNEGGSGGSGSAFSPSRYERFFLRPWLSDEARHFLFDERHLDPRVISWCRLTSWRDRQGVNWLQIPYYDTDGHLVGVQNRNLGAAGAPLLSPQGGMTSAAKTNFHSSPLGGTVGGSLGGSRGGLPRFRFPYGSRCSIYNLPMLRSLKPGDECWIAEGCSDCWSHMSAGHKCLAIPSATLLQPRDKALLQDVTVSLQIRWRMAPDQDEPGRRLAAQLREILPMLDIVELPPGCKDYSDYYLKLKVKG